MINALVIPADQKTPLRLVQLSQDIDEQVKQMHTILDGYLEVVPHPHGDEVSIYCNEEGKLMRLPINYRASQLWESIWNHQLDDVLVGNVILTGGVDEDGEITSIPDAVVKAMSNI